MWKGYHVFAMPCHPMSNVCHRKANVAILGAVRCVCLRPSTYCHDCRQDPCQGKEAHHKISRYMKISFLTLECVHHVFESLAVGVQNSGTLFRLKFYLDKLFQPNYLTFSRKTYFQGQKLWPELWDNEIPCWTAFPASLSAFFFSPKVRQIALLFSALCI